MDCITIFKDIIAPILTFLTSIVALVIACNALTISSKANQIYHDTLMHQQFANLTDEYRSNEMGLAVSKMWEYYENAKCDKKILIDKYVKDYKKGKDNKKSIHYHRRLVSHFYQQLASLYVSEILEFKIIKTRWTEKDLSIIPKILIPIGLEAIPLALNKEIQKIEEVQSLNNMLKLYNDIKNGA